MYRVGKWNVTRKWEKLPYSLCLPKQPIYPFKGYVSFPHTVRNPDFYWQYIENINKHESCPKLIISWQPTFPLYITASFFNISQMCNAQTWCMAFIHDVFWAARFVRQNVLGPEILLPMGCVKLGDLEVRSTNWKTLSWMMKFISISLNASFSSLFTCPFSIEPTTKVVDGCPLNDWEKDNDIRGI